MASLFENGISFNGYNCSEIIRSITDKNKIYIPCPIMGTYWHNSPNSCSLYISLDTFEYIHVYHGDICTLTADNNPINKLFDDILEACQGPITEKEHQLIKTTCIPYSTLNSNQYLDTTSMNLNLMPDEILVTIRNTINSAYQNIWKIVTPLYISINEDFENEIKLKSISANTHDDYIISNSTKLTSSNYILNMFKTPFDFIGSGSDETKFLITNMIMRHLEYDMPIINQMSKQQVINKILANAATFEKKPINSTVFTENRDPDLFFLDGRDLFDFLLRNIDNKMFFLRKIHMVTPQYHFDTLRRTIMSIISEYGIATYNPHWQGQRIKSTCNAAHFASSSSKQAAKLFVPEELRCSAHTIAQCPHIRALLTNHFIKEYKHKGTLLDLGSTNTVVQSLMSRLITDEFFSDENKILSQMAINKEIPVCTFLLFFYKQFFDNDEIDVSLGFSCLLSQKYNNIMNRDALIKSSIDDKKRVSHASKNLQALEKLFDRNNDLHRLCIPAKYLTSQWYIWFLKLLKINVDLIGITTINSQ
ncbi:hypothetical protein SGHV046 [Glossina pallidipes salivary gland hypertrophy virus]|uniref:Uncharacterized protein n=1 Tax=Glossina hytrovirus (isolate Glossina pallidipes/Ethiopia/Seibersdorf/-) TaxID=379529 RepID=B0YLK0_GHVS|nr:hypothetical protein SGHV046 [Glossina pallidipes salivary gland hypertrophy virus]ABQ08819.1 hypothetical protein SGHV046 [Glossina pallidipes salivary gland hypertrophy virus]